MPKRKFLWNFSTRYRRKLIRESDDLFPLDFNEERRANLDIITNNSVTNNDQNVISNNSASDNDQEEIVHLDFYNAVPYTVQETSNLSLSYERSFLEFDVSSDNISSNQTVTRESSNVEQENDSFKTFLTQWAITLKKKISKIK